MSKLLFLFAFVVSNAFATTIIPFKREVGRIDKHIYMTSTNETSDFFTNNYVGDEFDNLFSEGFGFQNIGPNQIVTTDPQGYDFANRSFAFVTFDESRRDNYLWIADYNGSGRMSDYFETMLAFLPRENQMHIEETGDFLFVTLNTGEEVVFSKHSKMILSGVLQEMPMEHRKFAQLTYSGKGLMIRSDAKGADPRLVPNVQIFKKGLAPCKVPANVFWTQEGFPKFQFVTDEEAYLAITKFCGAKYLLD